MDVKVKVNQDGSLPIKAHAADAGFDLFATSDFTIEPGEIIKHPLNIQMELPEGTYAEITSKSGNGVKGLLVYAGIIDQGYRGVVHVVMANINRNSSVAADTGELYGTIPGAFLTFKAGQKIAQMIVHPFSQKYRMVQVEDLDIATSRGSGGFGSTGNSLV
jgi:dUTP pyrophosphatase